MCTSCGVLMYAVWKVLFVPSEVDDLCSDSKVPKITTDAPIIGSVIDIGPIITFLGSISIGKFY